MNIIQQLEEEFPEYLINMVIRELAKDIEQADGVLDTVLFKAKITIEHMLSRKISSNMDIVKALLKAAADYFKKSGMFTPLYHGFASKCRECNCCLRDKAFIEGEQNV